MSNNRPLPSKLQAVAKEVAEQLDIGNGSTKFRRLYREAFDIVDTCDATDFELDSAISDFRERLTSAVMAWDN